MIQARLQISGQINGRESLTGGLNTSIKEIEPELENLTVTPLTEEQKFKSEKYGYDEVIVEKVTADIDSSIKPENIKEGETILGVPGGYKGIDTSDADATAKDIAMNKTAYVNGEKITGTLLEPSMSSISTDNIIDTGSRVDIEGKMPTDYLFRKNSVITYNIKYPSLANAIGLTSDKLVKGNTVIGVVGTHESLDTSDADATANDIAMNKTAYVNGEKVEGTLFELETASIATDDVVDNGSWVDIKSVLPQDYLFRKDSSITYNIAYKTLANAIGITPEKLITGNKVIGVSGNATSDADATAEDIVKGKTAYVNGEKIVGTYEGTSSGDTSEFNAIITANSAESSTFKVISSLREIGDLDLDGISNMNSSFQNYTKLRKIKSISNTTKVTSTSQTFDNCLELEEIPNFDTSNVTNMYKCFSYCNNITTIPVLNTSKVTNMSNMFEMSKKLLEVPLIDTQQVTNMSSMFYGCENLLTIPKFNTSNVTNMSLMFRGSGTKNGLEIPEIDTSNVTNMQGMFQYSGLVKAPKLNTEKVTNMTGIFGNMSKLKDVSDWDFSHITSLNQAFLNSLGPEEFGDFNTINVENFNNTFLGCSNLKTLGVVNAEKANNITQALYGKYGMALQNFGGFKDLGKNYTQKTANVSYYTLDLSTCNSLTHDSLMNVINNLYDLNLTYDVANGGTLYTQSLKLGSTNLAKLTTAEEIAIATAKGWTVS